MADPQRQGAVRGLLPAGRGQRTPLSDPADLPDRGAGRPARRGRGDRGRGRGRCVDHQGGRRAPRGPVRPAAPDRCGIRAGRGGQAADRAGDRLAAGASGPCHRPARQGHARCASRRPARRGRAEGAAWQGVRSAPGRRHRRRGGRPAGGAGPVRGARPSAAPVVLDRRDPRRRVGRAGRRRPRPPLPPAGRRPPQVGRRPPLRLTRECRRHSGEGRPDAMAIPAAPVLACTGDPACLQPGQLPRRAAVVARPRPGPLHGRGGGRLRRLQPRLRRPVLPRRGALRPAAAFAGLRRRPALLRDRLPGPWPDPQPLVGVRGAAALRRVSRPVPTASARPGSPRSSPTTNKAPHRAFSRAPPVPRCCSPGCGPGSPGAPTATFRCCSPAASHWSSPVCCRSSPAHGPRRPDPGPRGGTNRSASSHVW